MNLASPRVVNIKDLRRLARRRLPDAVFDYLDGAADDEVTLKDSERAFREVIFKPRFAVATPACDLGVTVLGHELDVPFLLGPIGYSRLMHPRGELAASKVAGKTGTAYILSTMSGHRIEDVKAQSSGPTFYQLYLAGGRGAAEGAIARAKAAGYKALFVTIDTPVAGNRERDVRNGMKALMGTNPFAKIPYLTNILAHPHWLAGFLADGMTRPFPNIVVPGSGPMAAIDVGAALESAQVSWTDLAWIRDQWNGPIVIKGVMTVDDARRSVDAGAAGIVVSTCRPSARRRGGIAARPAGHCGGGGHQDRSSVRWWHPARLRRGQGHRVGRQGGALGTRLCLWHGGGRRCRDRTRHRDFPRRHHPHLEAAGLRQHLAGGWFLRDHPSGIQSGLARETSR